MQKVACYLWLLERVYSTWFMSCGESPGRCAQSVNACGATVATRFRCDLICCVYSCSCLKRCTVLQCLVCCHSPVCVLHRHSAHLPYISTASICCFSEQCLISLACSVSDLKLFPMRWRGCTVRSIVDVVRFLAYVLRRVLCSDRYLPCITFAVVEDFCQ